MLSKEEIKKAIVTHFINYLENKKSLLEVNDTICEAYLSGQEQDINDAFDEVIKEVQAIIKK